MRSEGRCNLRRHFDVKGRYKGIYERCRVLYMLIGSLMHVSLDVNKEFESLFNCTQPGFLKVVKQARTLKNGKDAKTQLRRWLWDPASYRNTTPSSVPILFIPFHQPKSTSRPLSSSQDSNLRRLSTPPPSP